MMAPALKICLICLLFLVTTSRFYAQNNQTQTSLKVRQLIEKKAEYHRLTGGMQDGYRIKIHFDVDRDKAKATHAKFSARFPEYVVDEEYQLPYWVVMVGAFKTKLQAFEAYKKIQSEFPAFIIKAKIKAQ